MNCDPEFCPKCHDKKQNVHDSQAHPHVWYGNDKQLFWCAKCLVESTGAGAYLDLLIYLKDYNFIRLDKKPYWVTDEHWYCENCDHFLSWGDYRDADGEYV